MRNSIFRLLLIPFPLLFPICGYGDSEGSALVPKSEANAGAYIYMEKLLKGDGLAVSFFRETHGGHDLEETEARDLYCEKVLNNEDCGILFQRMEKVGESSLYLKWLSHYLQSHGSTFDIVGSKFQQQSEEFCKYIIAGRIGRLNLTLQHYSCSHTLDLEGRVSIKYINGIPLKEEVLEYGIEYEKGSS